MISYDFLEARSGKGMDFRGQLKTGVNNGFFRLLFLTKKNSENILLLRKGSLRTDFRRKSRLTKWNHRGNLSQECYFCLKRGFWHWKSKKLLRRSTQIFSSVLLVFHVILFLWDKENTGEKRKKWIKKWKSDGAEKPEEIFAYLMIYCSFL